jgi:hypothetical protein
LTLKEQRKLFLDPTTSKKFIFPSFFSRNFAYSIKDIYIENRECRETKEGRENKEGIEVMERSKRLIFKALRKFPLYT